MKRHIVKFDSHAIADFIVKGVARLSDYGYARHIQNNLHSRSLEIIVILEKHIKELHDIYTIVNHKISMCEAIPTFFRSGDDKAFLFPAGVNVHFATPEEFARNRDRWNVIGGVCESQFTSLLTASLKGEDAEILILDDTPYRHIDKEITSYWNKN